MSARVVMGEATVSSTEVDTEAIEAPSLSSMIMEWEYGSEPEPQLIDKLLRCEEGDVYKMYSQSQNRDMFSWKLIVLLNKTTLGEMKATRRELTNKKLASFRAVLAKEIIDYCHFFNNRNSCRKGDSCKFRHEDRPRGEQDKDCADRICQVKHSGTSKPQKAQSLGAQVVSAQEIIDYCHFFNNQNSCRKGDNCKFRHEDSPRCERDKDCTNRICQFKHNKKLKHRLASKSGQKQQ